MVNYRLNIFHFIVNCWSLILLRLFTSICCLGFIWLGSVAYGDGIHIVTTEFPPYSYQIKKGKFGGLSTEVVLEAMKRAQISVLSHTSFPWARAYSVALRQKNTLIYSISRSQEREQLFSWVGAIAPYRVSLYKLASRKDIQVKHLEDAKSYVIGGEYGDIKQKYLESKGFSPGKNIFLNSSSESNLQMLFRKRIDLLPFSKLAIVYTTRKLSLDMKALEEVIPLPDLSDDVYAAFNLNTPEDVVQKLKSALGSMKIDGTYQKIVQRYTAPGG